MFASLCAVLDLAEKLRKLASRFFYRAVTLCLKKLIQSVLRAVVRPTVDGMRARGTPYVGILYTGLMLTPDGEVIGYDRQERQGLLPPPPLEAIAAQNEAVTDNS